MSLDGRRSMSLGRVSAGAVTREVGARPGEVAACAVRVRNDGPAPTDLQVRVHGLGPSSPWVPVAGPPLAPGAEVDIEVPLAIPESFGVGAHSLAIEVGSGKPEDRSSLVKVVLTIGALSGVTMRIDPSVIRGGRRARFDVEVDNRNTVRADVVLDASGPDLRVGLAQRQISVAPGVTAVVEGRVRGPRRWVGDPAQHVLTVEARSGSVPIYATASYRQRAVLPRRARGGVIGVAFIALWALIAAAVVLLWVRDDPKSAQDQATNGSLTPLTNPDGTPADGTGSGTGTSSGTGSGSGSGSGGGGAAGGEGGAGSGAVTATILRGTVKAGATGADDGVLVTLTPTIPGETQQVETGGVAGPIAGDPAAALLQPGGPGEGMRLVANPSARPAAGDSPPTKFWPDRYGTYRPNGLDNVRTLSVSSVASDDDGAWRFDQVPLRQNYEVSFAKPGFTTQSFIVSPPDDGKPVELEVELQPGDGALGGVVSGNTGPAQVSITDGTLTFATTASTDGRDRGRWDVDSLSTPGTYTITVSSPGVGTEVMQVRLGPGESRTNLNIGLRSEVGSIAGSVSALGGARGGVTLTATSGDETITTTSLTEGATGSYLFPQLSLGSTYTVTASADGFITQTRSITVNGNVTGVDFALVKSTATVIGRVMSSNKGTVTPLESATVTLAAGELAVRTSSAAAPDAGAFTVTDLPPGTYVLAASRYDHPEVSQLVTLTAGQVFDAGEIVLGYSTRPPLTATGSLIIRTVDSDGQELTGANVQLIDVAGALPTRSDPMGPTESAASFENVAIGTYTVRVTKANYRPAAIERLTIGLGPVERHVTMLQYGTARGTVVDAVGGYEFGGAEVYVTADEPDISVQFDRTKPIILPPPAQVGEDAVAAYRTTHPTPADPMVAPAGQLVVEYPGGVFELDTNADGVPDQPLTLLRVGRRPLSGYELLLYRMSGQNPVCMGPIPTIDTEWEIDPTMELLDGDYVLRFSPLPGEGAGTACAGRGKAPDGYATIPTGPAGNVGAFTVADDLDRKVLLGPITVAPYTRISGRIVMPRVVDGAVQFGTFTGVQDDLTVELDCDAAGVATGAIGPGPGSAITFTFTRVQIQNSLGATPYDPTTGAIGSCTLRARYTADDYLPAERRIDVGVGLSEAGGYPDRTVSVAMVDDPGIITGFVWWHDRGVDPDDPDDDGDHAIAGAHLASVDDVITGFTPSVENDPADPDTSVAPTLDPDAVTGPVETTAGDDGMFLFALPGQRQVLDTAHYRVSGTSAYGSPFTPLGLLDPNDPDPNDPGSQVYPPLTITAEPGAWSATDVPDQVVDNGTSVDVYLDPPDGSISGNVAITTTRSDPPFGELRLTPTAPDGTVGAPISPNGAGSYTLAPTAAGTWELAWAETPGSNLLVTSTGAVPPALPTSPRRQFVDAGEPAVAPTVTAVELGQIDVVLTNDVGNAIDGNPNAATTTDDSNVSIALQGTPVVLPPEDPARSIVACGSVDLPPNPVAERCAGLGLGQARFSRLPVDEAQEVTYLVSASVPDYDEPSAEVTVEWLDSAGGVIAAETYAGTSDIPVRVRPGHRVRVTMAVPGFADLRGNVQSLTTPPDWGGTAATLPLIAFVPTDPPTPIPEGAVVVEATRRSTNEVYYAEPADPDGDGTPETNGDYQLRVPSDPLGYDITFTAVEHVTGGPIFTGPLDPEQLVTPTELAELDQTLQLQTATYSLTALTAVTGGANVNGALVRLYWGLIDPLNPPAAVPDPPVTVDGVAVVPDVYPGTYTLIIRNQTTAGVDDNYPVIATITIPRSAEGSNTVVSHRVVMPPVGGTIGGRVLARSQVEGRPALPLPAGLSVSRSYDRAQLGEGDADFLPNDATDGALQPTGPQPSLPLTETDPGDGEYRFDRLPYGEHILTFTDAVGFAPLPAHSVNVDGDEFWDIEYVAENVPVAANVHEPGSDDQVAGVTVALVPTVVGQDDPGDASIVDGRYRFRDVAPDVDEYELQITPPSGQQYATVDPVRFRVSTSDYPDGVELDVVLTPVIRISGTAQVRGASGTQGYTGPVELQLLDGTPVVETEATDGAYEFELTTVPAGPVQVAISPADHEPASAAVNGGAAVALRQAYTAPTITAEEHASADITVTGGSGIAGLTLTVSPSDGVITDGTPVDGAPGSWTTTSGTWHVSGLRHDDAYTYSITAPGYADADPFSHTAEAGVNWTAPEVGLTPLPVSVTVRAAAPAGWPAAVNATLTVLGSDGLAATEVGGTSGSGPWDLTGLLTDEEYTFQISSDNYTTDPVTTSFAPADTPDPIELPLVPKPATVTISVGEPPADLPAVAAADLEVLVDGSEASGLTGVTGSGPWTVTGVFTPGATYTFRITSSNYTFEDASTAVAPGSTVPLGARTPTPKPATATITFGGSSGTNSNSTLTSDNCGAGARQGPTSAVWIFSAIAVGTTCIFTADPPGAGGEFSGPVGGHTFDPGENFVYTVSPPP